MYIGVITHFFFLTVDPNFHVNGDIQVGGSPQSAAPGAVVPSAPRVVPSWHHLHPGAAAWHREGREAPGLRRSSVVVHLSGGGEMTLRFGEDEMAEVPPQKMDVYIYIYITQVLAISWWYLCNLCNLCKNLSM